MIKKWNRLLYSLLLITLSGSALAQIKLKIGNLVVDPNAMVQPTCLQVPLIFNDENTSRSLFDITITVEISGDTNIIDGGSATEMLVVNSFANGGSGSAGIQDPGVDLINGNGTPSPSCSAIINQATLGGQGIDFFSGNTNGTWLVNNDQGNVGRKQGFVVNFGGQLIGSTVQGQDILIAILEIPIIADPGIAQLLISATPNSVAIDGNRYHWDDGTRDADGERALANEALDISQAMGMIAIGLASDHLGVFRPSNNNFYLDLTGDNLYTGVGAGDGRFRLGTAGDLPLSGNWNGNGKDNTGVFRPSNNTFYLDMTEDNLYTGAATGDANFRVGTAGDLPVGGDFNGTGSDNIGVFRPSNNTFYIDLTGDNLYTGVGSGDGRFRIGAAGDLPLSGDFNGNGSDNLGVFRPSNNTFYIDLTGDNLYTGVGAGDGRFRLGTLGDLPVVGDWNGDGSDNLGVFRPSNNTFYIDLSGDNLYTGVGAGDGRFRIGTAGDIPLSGDW